MRAKTGTGGTDAELDGNREEVAARLLRDLRTTGDARQVDVGGLNKSLSTIDRLDELLGKATTVILV